MARRRICYVTGTRAEFGLMASTLKAIVSHPKLKLQLVVTGMHLSKAHGRTIEQIRRDGWRIDATVPWPAGTLAEATGGAVRGLARAMAKLKPDIVLVTGDRVEAFAAATAAHLDGRCVAHVHGGDRALGQVDDALRHSITKLSHLHFPATKQSGDRIFQLGEDRRRIYVVGTPGVDGIRQSVASGKAMASAVLPPGSSPIALLVYHPESTDDDAEYERATRLIAAAEAAGIAFGVIISSNNDPGWHGVVRAWQNVDRRRWQMFNNMTRNGYLVLLGKADVLIGNSSSGIIEAASVGTRVVNVGQRQAGRERSGNVVDVTWSAGAITRAVRAAVRSRFTGRNVYGGGRAGERISKILSDVVIDDRLMRKLIRY